MNSTRKLLHWMRSHPRTAVALAVLDILIPATWVFSDGDTRVYGTVFAVFLIVAAATISRQSKSMVAALVFGLMIPTVEAAPAPADPEPEFAPQGQVVLGVVVLAIGAVGVVCLAKVCKRHFAPPPDTNQLSQAQAPATAAVFALNDPQPCYQTAGTESGPARAVQFTIAPSAEGVRITDYAILDDTTDRLDDVLGPLGLTMPEVGQASFAPATTTEGATAIGIEDGVVTFGNATRTLTIERSSDMQHWRPALQVRTDGVLKFAEVLDATTFYRVALN